MLAFGGILFFLAAVLVVVVAAWLVMSYIRGTAEAAEEGIDRDQGVEPLDKVG